MAVLVRAIDKHQRLNIIPLSDPIADLVFSDLGLEFRWKTLHVLSCDNDILSGGTAVLYLIQVVFNLNSSIKALLATKPIQSLANCLYFKISKYRSNLGRFVPNFAPVRIKRDETYFN